MLHHIELYVSHLSKTRAFYDALMPQLGYTLYQEWEQGFSYQSADGTYLVFVQASDKYLAVGYHRQRIGLNHLAFCVDTTQTVDALRQFLLEKDVPLLYDERYPYAGGPNHYAVFFEDPDRVKLEVVAHSIDG
ncbi:VOC family protein [Aerococcaceae bacterium NML171108]|nr:VOC family protein [Aerococcaceae bacterium NML171108]